MCVGLSAKVVRINEGMAVVDAEQRGRFLRNFWMNWSREIM